MPKWKCWEVNVKNVGCTVLRFIASNLGGIYYLINHEETRFFFFKSGKLINFLHWKLQVLIGKSSTTWQLSITIFEYTRISGNLLGWATKRLGNRWFF